MALAAEAVLHNTSDSHGGWRPKPRLSACGDKARRRGLQNVRQRGVRWGSVPGNLRRQVLWPTTGRPFRRGFNRPRSTAHCPYYFVKLHEPQLRATPTGPPQRLPVSLLRLGHILHGDGRFAMAIGRRAGLGLGDRLRALRKLGDVLFGNQASLLVGVLDRLATS